MKLEGSEAPAILSQLNQSNALISRCFIASVAQIAPRPRPCATFCNMILLRWGIVSTPLNHKLEPSPLPATVCSTYSQLSATQCTGAVSPWSVTTWRGTSLWQGNCNVATELLNNYGIQSRCYKNTCFKYDFISTQDWGRSVAAR
jgi:hypothetical protein